MSKCTNCGSENLIILTTDYFENGWEMTVVRHYICRKCGETLTGTSVFSCREAYEVIEPISRKELQEKLYGRG
jgi:DNA-directed RNA polymerase subunit RPC12/RpoP